MREARAGEEVNANCDMTQWQNRTPQHQVAAACTDPLIKAQPAAECGMGADVAWAGQWAQEKPPIETIQPCAVHLKGVGDSEDWGTYRCEGVSV